MITGNVGGCNSKPVETNANNAPPRQEQRKLSALGEAALEYARRGWPIFPLWPRAKEPITKHGFKEATTDATQVRQWWSNHPRANIGLACPPNFLVLDVDPRHEGYTTLDAFLIEAGQHEFDTLTSLTGGVHEGRRGKHFLFKHPDFTIDTNKLGAGLEIKSNGYIVLPPSIHPESGLAYQWKDPKVPVAPAPEWLLTVIKEKLARKSNGERAPLPDGAINEGDRNESLFRIGCSLRARGLSETEIRGELLRQNRERCVPPLPDADIHKIAESAARYPQGSALGGCTVPGTRSFPYTDTGNGERLVERFGDNIRYCRPQKKWYGFNQVRWEPDETGLMYERVKTIARELYVEAVTIGDPEERSKCSEWARRCESAEKLRSALFCAESEQRINILPAQFDSNPLLLNVLNGTIDLKTGELRGHRRDDLITRLAPVKYDASARSELFVRFLEDSTGGDADLLEFLQRAVGYTLTGFTSEEVLFFLHGPTASGKTTFTDATRETLGDYARVADFETFLQRPQAGGVRNDVAELEGARLVASIEVDEGKKLAEGLIKMLTGGDVVRARFLYQEARQYRPQFKLWMAANHAPQVKDDDAAMWRRILRVPFDHTVPAERRDPTLKARLRDPAISGPAILAWAVEGCLKWQKDGLRVPEVVKKSTESYQRDMDPLRQFIEDCCTVDEDAWITSQNLRATYENWARENGERNILNNRGFTDRLRLRGCVPLLKKIDGINTRYWSGIGPRVEG
jgi:putative DNA primase/helicase